LAALPGQGKRVQPIWLTFHRRRFPPLPVRIAPPGQISVAEKTDAIDLALGQIGQVSEIAAGIPGAGPHCSNDPVQYGGARGRLCSSATTDRRPALLRHELRLLRYSPRQRPMMRGISSTCPRRTLIPALEKWRLFSGILRHALFGQLDQRLEDRLLLHVWLLVRASVRCVAVHGEARPGAGKPPRTGHYADRSPHLRSMLPLTSISPPGSPCGCGVRARGPGHA